MLAAAHRTGSVAVSRNLPPRLTRIGLVGERILTALGWVNRRFNAYRTEPIPVILGYRFCLYPLWVSHMAPTMFAEAAPEWT